MRVSQIPSILIVAMSVLLPAAGLASDTNEAFITIQEVSWAPSIKKKEIQVFEGSKSGKFEMKIRREGEKEKVFSIKDSEFRQISTGLLRISLRQKARRDPAALAKCRKALEVKISKLKESFSVCAGDYRTYFQVYGVVNRPIR